MAITANNTTLTFNDATTQTTSAVTAVNVSTGISSSGGKTPTLTNTGVTSLTAGTGISVSASTGGVTITNTGPTTTPQLQQQIFFSSGSWTAPAGVTRVAVSLVGGGGGGNGLWGTGGGSAGIAIGFVTVVSGTSYTVTIGGGGTGNAGGPGGTGGTTSFGSFISATGSAGGQNGEGNNGAAGTGTVSSGTNIKTGNLSFCPFQGLYPFIGSTARTPTNGAAVAYSATSIFKAGEPGIGNDAGQASGGVGGVVLIQWSGA